MLRLWLISVPGSLMSSDAVIAANRFGLGARLNEIQQAESGPKAFLIRQLITPEFNPALPGSDELLLHLADFTQKRRFAELSSACVLPGKHRKTGRGLKPFFQRSYQALCCDTLVRAIHSPDSLSWRLLDFFSNHFSVTAKGQKMAALAPTLEREAVAPNLLGDFEDMLLAVARHPCMLVYLNNDISLGSDSTIGKRRAKGLNENLAREMMELHTLGVNGGYTQADVIELAKGITGWSVALPLKDYKVGFYYRRNGHEPGNRVLLGKTYTQRGEAQGAAMITDLARHPATAEHLCFKLAKHFINDNPPRSLQDKMVTRWRQTNGNIRQVMTAMINAEESWRPRPEKFKTPREFVISAHRALNFTPENHQSLIRALNLLGQSPFKAGSPEGYGDIEADWNGPAALMSRVDWAARLVKHRAGMNPRRLSRRLFAGNVSENTQTLIRRAQSRPDALTLLLMSPEFLRR